MGGGFPDGPEDVGLAVQGRDAFGEGGWVVLEGREHVFGAAGVGGDDGLPFGDVEAFVVGLEVVAGWDGLGRARVCQCGCAL